ncbi:TIGR00300 family protein [Chthonomonas calidirosea]|uniref:ornithine cyclodeaminase n=1 Tax=Chthonomonas calidirosea TaxID=454171 RepID=UPI0006EC7D6F|nr:TIGR00300 family protein [Chthonomonas calidirosea]CEK14777.1 TIGR00300 family protein [Chthonomonas calidirosea]
MPSEIVRLDGHIIDSLTLSKVLDIILKEGGEYRVLRFQMGATRSDPSHAEIEISAPDNETLERILHATGQHGTERTAGEVRLVPAPKDGVLPEGFYATTNLETHVRLGNEWIPVQFIEMDCAIVVEHKEGTPIARCTPMHHVHEGELVVVGDTGVRVTPVERREPDDVFSFMGSDVSTERPKERVVAAIVHAMKETRQEGKKILFVGGPAIIHTGAGHYLEAIIRAGWIDVLFAGNALAAHDIEGALFGTSLGVEIATGTAMPHGHENHLRAINAIRAYGSIRRAVEAGFLRSGIMHACITTNTPFVLAGSIRDDGPLPDVITDVVEAQDKMRQHVRGVGVAIMVATTLHSVATGNLLPASVRTLCVDSDPDTVIKLMDRGTHQAFGLVTDCEFFLKELAAQLPNVKVVK